MAIDIHEYPDELNFNLPGTDHASKLAWEDDRKLFRQLVCWCMIQRYRYFVLQDPKVSDLEYDEVEKFTLDMRLESDYIKRMYCPLEKPGSSRKEDYPGFIVNAFDRHA